MRRRSTSHLTVDLSRSSGATIVESKPDPPARDFHRTDAMPASATAQESGS